MAQDIEWTDWAEYAAELFVLNRMAVRSGDVGYKTPRINCVNEIMSRPVTYPKEAEWVYKKISRRPFKSNVWRRLYRRHHCTENEAVLHIVRNYPDEVMICDYFTYLAANRAIAEAAEHSAL